LDFDKLRFYGEEDVHDNGVKVGTSAFDDDGAGGDVSEVAFVIATGIEGAQRNQLLCTVDTLEHAIDKWTAAVSARDERLKKAYSQLQSVADDRNVVISEFDDFVPKYNTAIEEIKKASDAIKQLAQERNTAVQKSNDLVGGMPYKKSVRTVISAIRKGDIRRSARFMYPNVISGWGGLRNECLRPVPRNN
jgi:hypothetical protein